MHHAFDRILYKTLVPIIIFIQKNNITTYG